MIQENEHAIPDTKIEELQNENTTLGLIRYNKIGEISTLILYYFF